jgi:hypothetical protein
VIESLFFLMFKIFDCLLCFFAVLAMCWTFRRFGPFYTRQTCAPHGSHVFSGSDYDLGTQL